MVHVFISGSKIFTLITYLIYSIKFKHVLQDFLLSSYKFFLLLIFVMMFVKTLLCMYMLYFMYFYPSSSIWNMTLYMWIIQSKLKFGCSRFISCKPSFVLFFLFLYLWCAACEQLNECWSLVCSSLVYFLCGFMCFL